MFTLVLTTLLGLVLFGITAVIGPGVSATDLAEMGVRLDDRCPGIPDGQ